ncbi:MAG: hypothetical protein IJ650_02380 [Paludibacteraceae bacterium]|nr:hypothetical protein [Paludibacteraceae bacterium]
MKRVFAALFSLLLCLSLSAQVKNYITLSGQIGEASYLYNIPDIDSKISGGAGLGLNVGYEMRYGAFLLDVAAGLNVTHSIVNVGAMNQVLENQVDDDPISGGDIFNYIYNQTGRKDSYTNLSLQVPVMIGAAAKHFYFLAGVKLDMSLLARASAKAVIDAELDYSPSGLDHTPVMPNHGSFNNYQVRQDPVKVEFKPQIMASAEIGYRFVETASGTGWDVPKEKNYWRLGLFFDYGLLNMNKPGDNENITLPKSYSADGMQDITINHIFSTKLAADSRVNNMMIGLKATYLFQLPQKRACTVCRDAYRAHSGRRR